MRKTLICLLTAASLGLAACGDDDGAGETVPLTPEQRNLAQMRAFGQAADRVCARADVVGEQTNDAINRLRINRNRLEDDDYVEDRLRQLAPLFRRQAEIRAAVATTLERIPLPEEPARAALAKSFISGMADHAELFSDAATAASNLEIKDYREARAGINRSTPTLANLAREFQMRICAQ